MGREFRLQERAFEKLSLLVDTSVWSLAFRSDGASAGVAQVETLVDAIDGGVEIYSTGVILQELLQGFSKPQSQKAILKRFSSIPMLIPDTADHAGAASIRIKCRSKGIQIGTIDALIAQLALRYNLGLLSTDKDFVHMQKVLDLNLA